MPAQPTHAELAEVLRSHRLGVDPSDLHGSLTGYLCAGGRTGVHDWLDALQLDCDDASVADDPLLQRMYFACCAQLESADGEMQPLLPAPATPVLRRADALVEWCRGFLGGFGLGGAGARVTLSAQASDVLADFGRIAAARLDRATDANDETALAAVLDFAVNGAALLQHEIEAGAAGRSLH